MQPAGGGRGARHARLRPRHRFGRAFVRGRQPCGARERQRRVDRQLPRRAARIRGRLPGHRCSGGGCDLRAQGGPHAGPAPVGGAATLPGRGARGELRVDGGPVHGGGPRGGEPPPRRACERRLDPYLGHAGGSRVDGLGRGAQAPLGHRQPDADPGGRAAGVGASPRSARAAQARARHCRGAHAAST